jgi:hypothetical protein
MTPLNAEPAAGDPPEKQESTLEVIASFEPKAPTWIFNKTLRQKEEQRWAELIEAASEKAPGGAAKCLQSAAPCLSMGAVGCEACGTIYVKAAFCIVSIMSRLPTDVFAVVWGLCLVFFGGFYPLTMAAFEAFRQCGGQDTYEAIHDVAVQLRFAKGAIDADDLLDEDHDGIADVEQIGATQLVKRRQRIVMTATDPVVLDKGFKGIYSAWLAVIAVLKLKFAQIIALGAACGDFVADLLRVPVTSVLVHVMDKETHKWIPNLIGYTTKIIAVVIAYHVQKVISAFYSAIRGGLMVMRSAMAILDRKGIVHIDPNETFIDEVLGWALAALGFYFQMKQWFSPPFWVEVLLWPLQMSEYGLLYAITSTKSPE